MKARAIGYSKKEAKEHKKISLTDLGDIKGEVVWVDVTGASQKDLNPLKEAYGFHHLSLDDCVRPIQRPKAEDYRSHLFLIAREMEYNKKISSNQLAVFLGENYLITVHEKDMQSVDSVWKATLEGNKRILSSSADFLLYTILDEITDNYFAALDKLEDKIESVEDEVVKKPSKKTLKRIFQLKKDLLMFRKPVWPTREVCHLLTARKLPNIREKNTPYFRDLYDHLIQVMDMIETYRELINGALETYMSSVSNNINEVMKVLTVIASIMLVPTLISGIYGMNFDTSISPYNMPELKWAYGYPFALGIMVLTVMVMLVYFRKKRWV